MISVVGIGHSHLHALTHAFTEFASLNPGQIKYTPICLLDTPFNAPLVTSDGEVKPGAELHDLLQRSLMDQDATVMLYLCGSEYWRWSVTPGPQPFDFIDPDDDDESPLIGQPLPYDLVLRHAYRVFDINFHPIIELLRRYPASSLIQLGPPPPLADLKGVLDDPQFQGFAEIFEQHGVSSARFRLKVWRLCSRAMREVCANLGVGWLAPPETTMDPDGFLRRELMGDAIHGNLGWGRLMLRRYLEMRQTPPKGI